MSRTACEGDRPKRCDATGRCKIATITCTSARFRRTPSAHTLCMRLVFKHYVRHSQLPQHLLRSNAEIDSHAPSMSRSCARLGGITIKGGALPERPAAIAAPLLELPPCGSAGRGLLRLLGHEASTVKSSIAAAYNCAAFDGKVRLAAHSACVRACFPIAKSLECQTDSEAASTWATEELEALTNRWKQLRHDFIPMQELACI